MVIIKKIVHILANICYIGISIYVLVLLPIIFGYHPLVVLSGSMDSTYPVGSVVYYHKVDKEDLKVKDIITYQLDGEENVTHRIVLIVDDKYQTKGDANNVVDEKLVEFKDIKGKTATFYVAYIGIFIHAVSSNMAYLVILAIILVSEFVLQNVKTLDIEKEGMIKNEKKQ